MMREAVIYVHGKGGNAAEAEHYAPLFTRGDVLGFDYRAQTPWEAEEEFRAYFDARRMEYDCVTLLANSIGAFFSMNALSPEQIDRALLISPVVDMEKLIADMMGWAGVTEDELCRRGEIPTDFGETLSWKYLGYVRAHPIKWSVPTSILYGERDNLTSLETMTAFAEATGAALTVMPEGEHWFHTDAQMAFLDAWFAKNI